MPILPEQTVRYKTNVKRAVVEGLRSVFTSHPDEYMAETKIGLDYPTSENSYPLVLIRFYERTVRNAGVGHVEYLVQEGSDPFDTTAVRHKFRHYHFDGTVEFAIYALSSRDRDLLSDAVVQALTMPDMSAYTARFTSRLYNKPSTAEVISNDGYQDDRYNSLTLNHDKIQGFGETQTQQPWLSEDQLQYQTSYRVDAFGEYYSLPPFDPGPVSVIQRVDFYPYMEGDTVPTGANDPSVWQ